MKAKTNGTAAVSPDGRYTYKEYKSWPEGERWELIEGVAFGRVQDYRAGEAVPSSVLEGFSWKASSW